MLEVVQAVRGALAAWLRTQLPAQLTPDAPAVDVLERWPTPGRKLAPLAVAVTVVGEPEFEPHSPKWHTVRQTSGVAGTVVFSYGRATLGLQLDAWAATPADRSALMRALDAALNVHPTVSLRTLPPGARPYSARWPGLTLALPDLYGEPCAFDLTAVALPVEGGDGAQQSEWRATLAGDARCYVTQQQTVALIKRFVLSTALNDGSPETTTDP